MVLGTVERCRVAGTRLLLASLATLAIAADVPTTRPATTPATAQPATAPAAATKPAATKPADTRPAADPAVAAKVHKLLDGLSDPDWKTRKRTVDELERLGEAAEPVLREVVRRQDLTLDARTAIEVLLRESAERRRIGASLVTLDLKAASPLEVMSAITAQAGLALSDEARDLLRKQDGQKLDLVLDREPFWSSLLKATGELKLAFVGFNGGQIDLASVAGESGAGPAAAEGPFLLTLSRAEVMKRRDFAARRAGGQGPANVFGGNVPLRLSFAAWTEPRLKPGSWMLDGVTECAADNGKTFTAQRLGYTSRNPTVNDGTETLVPLSGDVEGATRIVTLTVQARFILQWETEKLEVENPQGVNELAKNVAGNLVVVKSVKKAADDTWTFEVSVQRGERTAEEWSVFQRTLDRQSCKLVDANGKALEQRGSGSSWGGDQIRLTGTVMQGAGTGEPKKLVWELPAKIETLPATFQFKDIPLP